MNLQLDNVITDITGKTGIAIFRDIVAGQRDRKVLAKHRDPNCKNSEEIIEKSFKGNYCDEHVFQLEQSLELYDFLSQRIMACEKKIEHMFGKRPVDTNVFRFHHFENTPVAVVDANATFLIS